MGIIIREWKCGDCGSLFESADAPEQVECPTCSAAEPERVFLTPPGIKSPKTSIADRELKNLAADYGLSNISNKDGAAVMKPPVGGAGAQFTGANPQVQQALSKLGGHADGFSPLMPALRAAGRPHEWHRTPDRK